jgi:hypothetical protein
MVCAVKWVFWVTFTKERTFIVLPSTVLKLSFNRDHKMRFNFKISKALIVPNYTEMNGSAKIEIHLK